MQVTIILVRVPVHALQSSQCNDRILRTPHLSFDLERDLLLRFSFLSLSLSLSLCRSLSRLHGSSRKPHANIMALETLSAARGKDASRWGGWAYLSWSASAIMPAASCFGSACRGHHAG